MAKKRVVGDKDAVIAQRNAELSERWGEIQILRESEKHRKELIEEVETLRTGIRQIADEHTNTIEKKVKLSLALQAALMWLDALEYALGKGEKFVECMPYKCPTRSQMRLLISKPMSEPISVSPKAENQ